MSTRRRTRGRRLSGKLISPSKAMLGDNDDAENSSRRGNVGNGAVGAAVDKDNSSGSRRRSGRGGRKSKGDRRTSGAAAVLAAVEAQSAADSSSAGSSPSKRRKSRSSRRRSHRFSIGGRRRRSLGGPGDGAARELTSLTDEELTSMYKSTIKLSSANKINSKNAFQLQLIDRIKQVINVVSTSAETTNFQHVGCVVEAAAKIYQARVEDTYRAAERLISNMSSVGAEGADGEGGDDDADGDGENNGEGASSRRGRRALSKKLCVTKTLETNLSNIRVRTVDLECDVDPVFARLERKFDAGGAHGMLLNNMPVVMGPSIVAIEEEEHEHEDEDEDEAPAGEDDQSEESEPQETPAAASMPAVLALDVAALLPAQDGAGRLCCGSNALYAQHTQFARFLTGGGGPAGDAAAASGPVAAGSATASPRPQLDSGANDDYDIGTPDDYDDVYDGDDGDDAFGAAFADSFLGGDADAESSAADGVVEISSEAVSTYQSDYGYAALSSFVNRNWAGPKFSHWRRKKLQRETHEGSAKKRAAGGNKGRAAAPKIDFFADPVDATSAFAEPARKKTSTQQSEQARETERSDLGAYLLPEDTHFEERDLLRLFLRPQALVRVRTRAAGDGNGAAVIAGTGGTPSDDGEGAGTDDEPAHFDYDDGHDTDGYTFAADAVAQAAASAHADEPLSPSDPESLGYQKVNKTFNVRKLKSELWARIEPQAPVRPEANEFAESRPRDVHSEQALAESAEARTAIFGDAASFSGTLEHLKPQLPADTSVPVMFLFLLFLANEQGLTLDGDAEMGDVRVVRNTNNE